MPEIGEVARVVHYIRERLVGKTIAKVTAQNDDNVYGKVGCSAEAFEKALIGKRILNAMQQGKYFWMVMSSPPHPLMHFGMAGELKFRNEDSLYYKPKKANVPEEWPPKYWKFVLETEQNPSYQVAFVDFRRFGRIRLIDCAADNIRNVSPLLENGPDPVVDHNTLTEEWLKEKLQSKKMPVKALLLDQANISGIGNWVGDEILYNAKVHPEQYSNTLTADQITQLHQSIHHVCKLSVDTLADPEKFPKDWLFKHRWSKGKKDSPMTLPNGKRFVFLKVGGRTSCVVPSVQKKTGPVAGDVKEATVEDDEAGEGTVKPKKRKTSAGAAENTGMEEDGSPAKPTGGKKRRAKQEVEDPLVVDSIGSNGGSDKKSAAKRRESAAEAPQAEEVDSKRQKKATKGVKAVRDTENDGRRRSKRVSGKSL
ncbi:MAG: hypothetical protein Q9163_000903 [Psora crenata]